MIISVMAIMILAIAAYCIVFAMVISKVSEETHPQLNRNKLEEAQLQLSSSNVTLQSRNQGL